jgi:hypothetical protein
MYRRYHPRASHTVIKNHALRSRLALIFARVSPWVVTNKSPSQFLLPYRTE